MYVPKSVLLGLLVAAAGVVGWVLHGLVSDADDVADATPVTSVAAQAPDADGPVDPDGGAGDTIVTVVLPADGGTAASPPATVVTTAPGAGHAPTDADRASTSDGGPLAGSRSTAAATAPRGRAVPRVGPSSGSTAPVPPAGVVRSLGGEGSGETTGIALSVARNHIVIAHDDSIVFIGDDGRMTANTGDASSSGTVALEVDGSDLTSGDSAALGASSASGLAAGPGGAVQVATGTLDLGPAPGRAVSISGYEDHSIAVVGSDNVATYDDSNVFIARDGQINANTGDTDSSGLNVVDATGSVVRSGHSTDGSDTDEPEDPDETEEPDEIGQPDGADAPLQGAGGTPAAGPQITAGAAGTTAPSMATGSVADEGDTTASGSSAVVIGADGYDDLALDVAGQRNVATYDDSNTVIGGSGDVNAQIGDSDTGGAVVMGVEDSLVEAGPSD